MVIEIRIVKTKREKNKAINMDALIVEIEIDGNITVECFDRYKYWTKKIDGKERYKTRIEENYGGEIIEV